MITNQISDEARKWFVFFFLKTNLIILALFLLVNGLIGASLLFVSIALVLLLIGGVLVYHDIQTDPYQILLLMKVQTILYFRLRGPFISRKPFYFYFPEGSQFQETYITQTIAVQEKDLINGTNLNITVKTAHICPKCDGKRSKPMTVQIECSHCQNGKKLYELQTMFIPIPCKYCLGIGWIPVQSCSLCQGKGSIWQKRKIRVKIPPNTKPNTKLRIPGLGKINTKTLQQGDLYLKLRKKVFGIF